MAKDFDVMEDSNRSANPSIHEISDPSPLPRNTTIVEQLVSMPDEAYLATKFRVF